MSREWTHVDYCYTDVGLVPSLFTPHYILKCFIMAVGLFGPYIQVCALDKGCQMYSLVNFIFIWRFFSWILLWSTLVSVYCLIKFFHKRSQLSVFISRGSDHSKVNGAAKSYKLQIAESRDHRAINSIASTHQWIPSCILYIQRGSHLFPS